MEPPLICSAFENPDLHIRLKSIEAITEISMNEELLINVIAPSLYKYLDDCEEVLLLIVTQIVKLCFVCNSKTAALKLLPILEILAHIIDESVRQSAVRALIQILNFYSLTELHSIKFLKRLTPVHQPALFSALELISSTFPTLSSKKQIKVLHILLHTFKASFPNAKAQIAEFLKSLPKNPHLFKSFFTCMQTFLMDSEDLIRIHGVDLSLTLKIDIFTLGSIVKDESWKVRYFIGQQISRIVEYTDKAQLCALVKEYLNDVELEVRNVTFMNLSVLFSHAIDEIFINEILLHVRDISAELPFMSFEVILSAVKLCAAVGKIRTETYLLNALQALFECQDANIEMLLMQEIKTIHQVVSEEFLQIYAFPVVFKLLEHKLWRIREKALEYLPGLGFLEMKQFSLCFNRFIIAGLNDLVHAVRSAAIKTVSEVFGVYGEAWFREHFLQVLYEKSVSECFISRITAVNLLEGLKEKLDFERFGEFFFEIFQRLSGDRVVNVRICVARLGGKIESSRVMERFRDGFEESVRKLQMDLDADVRALIFRES